MRILLQFPEGLRTKAIELAKKLEEEGHEVIISAEACYGACDLRIKEAKMLDCDKIIHYGHTRFLKTDIPVEYIEVREKIELSEKMKNELKKIKEKRIGLVASLQFIDLMQDVKEFLEHNGKEVFIGDGRDDEKFLYPGQILGCDVTEAKKVKKLVEAFLVVTTGNFHPLGLTLSSQKPVYILNVEKSELVSIDAEKFVKQKIIAQELFKDAKKIGIIVSSKPGQFNYELAKKIKEIISKKGKEAHILIVDEVKPEKFEYMGFNALVNTACPRIVIEERPLYKIPILNPDEFFEIYR